MINKFDGDYFFLSNFFEAPVHYDGLWYQNSEAAFQAQKTLSLAKRLRLSSMNPSMAKKMGRSVQLRSDWESIKDQVMYDIVRAKFTQNEELRQKLLDTGTQELVEGNTWNDRYWGVCNGEGLNKLGQILMRVRSELREDKA